LKPSARTGTAEAEPLGERVLVVDDEANVRTVLCALLERDGLAAVQAAGGQEALERLRTAPFAAVLTDLKMPGVDGLELLSAVGREFPGMPVVLLTAHGTVETAIQAMRLGAFDFLTKPFDRDEVRTVVRKAVATGCHSFKDAQPGAAEGRFRMVGGSAGMQEVYRLIDRVAGHDTAVLILGESGTGKELVARAIHQESPRRDASFIKVNCAAIPPTLAESELFGHEKGAFSGAVLARPGKFELADRGTLFLDEIGEMPLEVQPKLLRALQDGEVERVGSTAPRHVNVRILAATNVDLGRAVAEKRFREDLFFRLSVVPIRLPPLRERPEDLPQLVTRFLADSGRKIGRAFSGVTPALFQALGSHAFPGNVRELENLIERMAILADGPLLDLVDLPPELRGGAGDAPRPASGSAPASPSARGPLKDQVRAAVQAVERNAILRALQATGWNVTRSAERLGVSRKGLQLKMREYDLRRRGDDSPGPPDGPAEGDPPTGA
jgi:DNA-binding NtrC family response regulator